MLSHALDLLKGGWRYARGLRSFLSVTIDLEEARALIAADYQNREANFLRVLERGIYGNPDSPYRRLLLHAGYDFEDVRSLIHERGLEDALSQLHDAGVFITLDEFKGRAPVRRPGLEFEVTERDFDNPLLTSHYEANSGGSRSGGNRVPFDFDFLTHEAAVNLCHLHANGCADRPIVLCQAAPPASHGLTNLFRLSRAGHMPVRWFSPSKPARNRQGLQGRLLTAYTLIASRLFGHPVPGPVYLVNGDVTPVVKFLTEAVRQGKPALVRSVLGQAVRICLAAEQAGLDISGTMFFCGGEPYTAGKAAVLARVGAEGIPHYGMSEIGQVGFRCGAPSGPDDMHMTPDKIVILQRPMEVAPGHVVQVLYHTSLLTSSPKLMLNVDSGDYAVIEERECGCLWGQMGYTSHFHSVHSYEKLTSEGVTFMGSMLYELLEETLPSRFGGSPTDYQLVEEEENGQPRVSLLISPDIGPVDEVAVLEAVIEGVGFADWSRRMADEWRRAGTLRIQRREAYTTSAAKILPLHVLGSASGPIAQDAPQSPRD